MNPHIMAKLQTIKQSYIFNVEMKHKMEAVIQTLKNDLLRLENSPKTPLTDLLIKKKLIEIDIEKLMLDTHKQSYLNSDIELLFQIAKEVEKST